MEITTSRLRLVCLSARQLELLITNISQLAKELSITLPASLITPAFEHAIGIKRVRLAGAPTERHPWHTYWLIIHTQSATGIGLVGFKGLSESGEAEIGYGIDESFRGSGLMTEAALGLIDWAKRTPSCKAVTASRVKPENMASQKVLKKLGFTFLRQDEEGLWYRLDWS